jgi:hypothetical protein
MVRRVNSFLVTAILLAANVLQGLEIEHIAIECAVVGKFISLEGTTTMYSHASPHGRVYFRADGAVDDAFVAFTIEPDGAFRAVLPRPGPLTEGIEYQVALIDPEGREVRDTRHKVTISSQAFCDSQKLRSPSPIETPVAALELGISRWGQSSIPDGFLNTGVAQIVMPDGSKRTVVSAGAPGGTEKVASKAPVGPNSLGGVGSQPGETSPAPRKRKSSTGWIIGGVAGAGLLAAAAGGGGGGGDTDTPPTPSCMVTENPERTCADGRDNDCDGRTDSNDSDCTAAVTMTADQGLNDRYRDEVLGLILDGTELCRTPVGGQCSISRSLAPGSHHLGVRLISDTGASGGSRAGTDFCLRLSTSGGAATFTTNGSTQLCDQINGIGTTRNFSVSVSK